MVESAPVPVLIVDDQAPFRRAAHAVITATDGFTVVGEAESGEEAVEMADALEPGLVLMDINLPGINGIEATRRITSAHPKAVVMHALHVPGRRSARRRRSTAARPRTSTRRNSVPRSSETCGPDTAWRRTARPRTAERDPTVDLRAPPGRRLHHDAAADGADPVAHVHEAVAASARRRRGRSRRRRRRRRTAARLPPRARRSVASDPSPACFAAFWSASRQQK